MDGAARTRDPEPANTFTQHSQHPEPWGLSDFCLEKSEIVSLLSVDCIVTQWNQLYSAILYFFEEKSDLLWRGEMWAQSNGEKVTVFCAENGINVLFVEKLLWRLEAAMGIVLIPSTGDILLWCIVCNGQAGLTIDWCAIFWLITSNKIPGRGLWLISLVATLPRLADRLTIMPGFILVLRREWCTNITHRGLGTGPNKVELTWILWRLSSRVSPSPSRNHATLRGHNNFPVTVELEKNLHEVFTITEKAPTRVLIDSYSESGSSHFQPGEGHNRSLFRDCESLRRFVSSSSW